jgi:hypothetical protein
MKSDRQKPGGETTSQRDHTSLNSSTNGAVVFVGLPRKLTDQEQFEAQMEAAVDAFRAAVLRLLREGKVQVAQQPVERVLSLALHVL